jgi:MFS family permease
VAELTIARVLQGLGGALMVPVGRLLLFRDVPKRQLVDVMAFLQVPSQLGPLLGPPLGGFITTYASWRLVFLINIPIGIAGIVLASLYISDDSENQRRPLDYFGFLFSSVAVTGIMVGVELVSRSNWGMILGLGVIMAGVAIGGIAVWHMNRHPFPILDMSVLRVRTFAVNFWGGSLFRAGTGSLSCLFPRLFQTIFGMSAVASGLLTLASAVGSMTMRLSAGRILRRFGFRSVLTLNTLLSASFIAACLMFEATTPSPILFGVLLIGGFIQSLQFTSLQVLAYADVTDAQMSSATTIASMVQQLSRGLGISLIAGLLRVADTRDGAHALAHSDVSAAFALSAVIVMLSLPFYLLLAQDEAAEVSGHSRPPARRRPK